MPDYDVETNQGGVTISLDREVDPALFSKSPKIMAAVKDALRAKLGSTTTTPTTTEGVPGQGVQIPTSVDAPVEAAGAGIGSILSAPAVPRMGPSALFAGAGAGGGMAHEALDFLRGNPRAAAARARATLAGEQPGAFTGLPEQASGAAQAVGRGVEGEALGQVAVPAGVAAARATGLTRALPAGARAVRDAARGYGIDLLASDIRQSKPVAMLEKIPSYFTFGSGIMQHAREGQISAAGKATTDLVDSIAKSGADEITAGRMAQGGIRAAVRGFDEDADRVFRAIDAKVGPGPVVPTENFRAAVRSELQATRQTPYGPSSAARRFKGGEDVIEPTGQSARASYLDEPFGSSPGEAQQFAPATPGQKQLETRSPVPGRAVDQGTIPGAESAGKLSETDIYEAISRERIPWRLARDIESQLGEVAFRGGEPIGTIKQGQAKALYRAIRDDMDTMMGEPGHEGLGPELAEAKQLYSTGKRLFKESVVRAMARTKTPMAEEAIVGRAFRPGQTGDTRDFKMAVTDDVYQEAVGAWLNSIKDKATTLVGGQPTFSPATFVSEISKYEKNGQLDAILPPNDAREVRRLVSVLGRLGTAERLAGNTSGTAMAIKSADQLLALGSGGVGLFTHGDPRALGAAASSFAMPPALAKFVTSPGGIDFLSEGFKGTLAKPALRFGARLLPQLQTPLPSDDRRGDSARSSVRLNMPLNPALMEQLIGMQ